MKDSFCRLDVMFSDGEEKCVTLTGHLLYNNGKNFVSFRKTDLFCSAEPPVKSELGESSTTLFYRVFYGNSHFSLV